MYAAAEKGTAMMSKNNGMMKYHLLKRRCIIKQNTTAVFEKKDEYVSSYLEGLQYLFKRSW